MDRSHPVSSPPQSLAGVASDGGAESGCLTGESPGRGARPVGALVPWGSPPTPLLPRWYRETLSGLRLPWELASIDPGVKTVGDLDRFWDHQRTPIRKEHWLEMVKFISAHVVPPDDLTVILAGFDLAVLADYPLKTRTKNAISRDLARGELGKDGAPVWWGNCCRSPTSGRPRSSIACASQKRRCLKRPHDRPTPRMRLPGQTPYSGIGRLLPHPRVSSQRSTACIEPNPQRPSTVSLPMEPLRESPPKCGACS